MVTLRLLGPQLARQHGVTGWLASPALNRLHRDVNARAVAELAPTSGETVADIGFGGGIGLRMLLDAVGPAGAVHGVELSALSVGRARLLYRAAVSGGRLSLHEAPVEHLPLAPGTLDGALTVNTIHHFADLDVAFRSIAETLRPGGRLVLAFPDPGRQAALPLTSRHRHRPRPREEVERSLRDAGLLPGPQPTRSGIYRIVRATRST